METLTDAQWTALAEAKINGRQIKNAVKSCQGLASSEGRTIQFEHLTEVLSIMAQFEEDFKVERTSGIKRKRQHPDEGNHSEDADQDDNSATSAASVTKMSRPSII